MKKINSTRVFLRLLTISVMSIGSVTAGAQVLVTSVAATGANDPVAPNYLLTDFQNAIQIGAGAGLPLSYLNGCTLGKYAAPLNSDKSKAIYQFLTMMKLSEKPVTFNAIKDLSSPYSCLITDVGSF